MTTIRGENISEIRPKIPYQARIYKEERIQIKYNKRSRRIKEHCGKVVATCLRLIDGTILSIQRSCMHLEVTMKYSVDVEQIESTGWQLDNGNYLWR